MNDSRIYSLTAVTWALASACLAVTQTQGDLRAPEGMPKNGTPELRLASLPGFSDDAAFLASVAGRVAELRQRAGETADPERKAAILLAAANLILAEELEPPCSRKFLQLNKPELNDNALPDAPALERSDALLAEAETLLRTKQEPSPDDDQPLTEQAKELGRNLVTLKAFAHALRAYLIAEADVDPSRSARRAASGLSVIVEDDNPQIAAAAAFWQATLRAMEPDPMPALDILEPATGNLPTDAPRFGFFSRLLRVRLVAARGGPVVALALLMQVEEQTDDWFKSESDRPDALRACAWLRLQILKDWYDHLDSTSQVDERAWCKSQMETLRADRFSDPAGVTVLRLIQAIPIIARAPEPTATSPEGTPSPR